MISTTCSCSPHHKIWFQRSRLLGFALGRVPGCVGVAASWDLLWTVHFRCNKIYTLQSDYFGFSLIFWLLKFLKCWVVILAAMLQQEKWPQSFPLKLCITAPCGNKTVCFHCSLLISDVDSWHKFQKSMSPLCALCLIVARGWTKQDAWTVNVGKTNRHQHWHSDRHMMNMTS